MAGRHDADGEGPDAPDEFDVEGPDSHRRGVHRARPGAVSRWGPTALTLATVAAVLLLVVASLVLVGPRGIASLASQGWDALTSGGDDDPTTTPDPAATDPAPTDPAPTDPGPTDPAPTDPAPTDPAPTDPAPTEPAPTADQGVPVVVLNGTTTTGLAGGAAAALEELGWSVERTDNYRDEDVPTTVYYADPALAATAAALAADVGGVAQVSDLFGDELVVVLGADYVG